MPSAANVKIDKQISPESALADSGNSTPLRQAITIIEHKIRNLEKRKAKLESYRELQNAGKELNSDQKTAVAKYDEVIQTLDFARDLCKQFLGIAACSEKEAKKLAKKEAAAKNQAELARLREILLVQDALHQMGNEQVRDDFLHGRNGAAQLSETDLKLLDDLYPAVTPKHEVGNPTAFTNEVQAAAEHLLAVVDGKPKEAFGGTYSQIKEVLGKIHESGYFDQAQEIVETVEAQEIVQVEGNLDSETLQQGDQSSVIPPIEPIPVENVIPVSHPPPLETLPVEPSLPPEQIFYPQQPPQPLPAQQPLRPITEMLGTGSFFFLQDSEIDAPLDQQIPSQTFTNQSFVNAPPPPIPMPPHFQNMSSNLPPPQIVQPGNNGLDDVYHKQEEPHKQNATGNRPPRNNPSNNANQQSYYQNNGYSNRPRQNRNQGSRTSNRHN